MQLIGIGIPELLLIMVLTVLVVGPDRLPEMAAQLARWIRTARAYANTVSKDFQEVAKELEKETGASRKDFEEIASVLRRDTKSVFDEIDKAGKEVEEAANLEKAAGGSFIPLAGGTPANGASANGATDSTALKEAAMAGDAMASEPPSGDPPTGDPAQPEEWFKPSPGRRRRRAEGDGP